MKKLLSDDQSIFSGQHSEKETQTADRAIGEVSRGFKTVFGREPQKICFAPGRVNLIGEHTDYNGGYVLPCAIDLGIYCAAARRSDRTLRLYSDNFQSSPIMTYDLDELSLQGCWSDYAVGVIKAMNVVGYILDRGAVFYFHSTLPDGAGLSSSAALELSVGVMLRSLYMLPLTGQELALLGKTAENRFIGVNCGIMDQFASSMGKRGNAILLSSNDLRYKYAPLGDIAVVIVNSGVKHSLAGSAYNDRRRECDNARNMLGVTSLCSLNKEEFDKRSDVITDSVCLRRARHAVYENRRTLDAAAALEKGDYKEFGRLMNESHASLRDDYEVSCEELDFLADFSQGFSGVYGSRMTGGGFGGCTVSLMPSDIVPEYTVAVKEAFLRRFKTDPPVYCITASDGAQIIKED